MVQITSQQAQIEKATQTLKRLREQDVVYQTLVMVYRDAVASSVRRAIQESGSKVGVAIDVRDESYLVTQLGKPGSSLFARYFQGTRAQMDILLGEGDPLSFVSKRQQSAILASISAYVLSPTARLVRTTLFDRTVLALVADAGGDTELEQLQGSLAALLPQIQVDRARIRASLDRLADLGLALVTGNRASTTELSQIQLASALSRIRSSIESLVQFMTQSADSRHRVSDAEKGRIESNTRKALLFLVRTLGPSRTVGEDDDLPLTESRAALQRILGRGLPERVGNTLVSALSHYVQEPENARSLAQFARSYAALFLWNLDPVGRRWQQKNLQRATLILDTDALLTLVIEDLPFNEPLQNALSALLEEGVSVTIPREMVREAVEHIGRARKTYNRCGPSLIWWSKELAEERVWHALVLGYYYHRSRGGNLSFQVYWSQYHDERRPVQHMEFLLGRRARSSFVDTIELDESDRADYEVLHDSVLRNRERSRKKAKFRDAEMMDARVAMDVKAALYLARYAERSGAGVPNGYVVSEDRCYGHMQRHAVWGERSRVWIPMRALPSLAEFVCGARLDDDQFVRLLFNPVLAAAAAGIATELQTLAEVGTDLRQRDVFSLEWEVSGELQRSIAEYEEAARSKDGTPEERVLAALSLAESATAAGLPMHEGVGEVLVKYQAVEKEADALKGETERMREIVRRLVDAAGVTTKKGRRRVNRVLEEFGGLSALLGEDPDE